MLPPAAVYQFPWELNSGSEQEGDSVRTFGKWVTCLLTQYDPEKSLATLSTHHSSKHHCVIVHTLFVEPFDAVTGAQYIVLGELENIEGKSVGVMVRARVLNCVDGANIALLQRAINDQRRFLEERKPAVKGGD
uniref:CST complex subunit TEN1 n=1 Tax=Periophthalmus magnuspinnatus TaxID=409849 RepID=A0A3B4ADG0_9GOBI